MDLYVLLGKLAEAFGWAIEKAILGFAWFFGGGEAVDALIELMNEAEEACAPMA